MHYKLEAALINIAMLWLLGGCADVRLNNNAVDISATVTDVYKRQVLENFSRLIDNPHGIPSFMDLSSGTVQTTDTVNPSLTFPLTPQVVNSAAGAVLTHGNTTAGAGAGINGTATQQQNWNVSPVINANTLRRLRALYEFALFGKPLQDNYFPLKVLVDNKFYYDPYQLQEPQCILCNAHSVVLDPNPAFYHNKRLHPSWIYWKLHGEPGEIGAVPAGVPYVDLGVYGGHQLLMKRTDFDAGFLDDFVLFVMPNEPIFEAFVPTTTPTVKSPSKSKVATRAPSAGTDHKDVAAGAPSPDRRPNPAPGRLDLHVDPKTLNLPLPEPRSSAPIQTQTFPAGSRPEPGRGTTKFVPFLGIQP